MFGSCTFVVRFAEPNICIFNGTWLNRARHFTSDNVPVEPAGSVPERSSLQTVVIGCHRLVAMEKLTSCPVGQR